MIVVDSGVWVDSYRGVVTRESDYLDSILGVVPVAVGDFSRKAERPQSAMPLIPA